MLCVDIRVHVPCVMLYAQLNAQAHRYGNFIHLQISLETYLPPPTTTTNTIPIKPNYTILLFLFNNKEGCWGCVRGRDLM